MLTGRKELQKGQKSEGYNKTGDKAKKDESLAKALRANLLRRKAATLPKKGGG